MNSGYQRSAAVRLEARLHLKHSRSSRVVTGPASYCFEVDVKFSKHLPVAGVAAALCLFVIAAHRYPGGTSQSAASVGYSWTQNFMSSLFAARALNGAANPSRYVAIPALLVLCLSLGLVFARIAVSASSPGHRKTIQIAGIGAMVYAFLIATPMHDLMISVALVFTLVAVVASLHLLRIERAWFLFTWGILCFAILLVNAVSYYANALATLLPTMQKLNWAMSVSWLLSVYYARLNIRRSAPIYQ